VAPARCDDDDAILDAAAGRQHDAITTTTSCDDDVREEAAGVQRDTINAPTSRDDGVRDEAGAQRGDISTTCEARR
jgi:hypothetical protein